MYTFYISQSIKKESNKDERIDIIIKGFDFIHFLEHCKIQSKENDNTICSVVNNIRSKKDTHFIDSKIQKHLHHFFESSHYLLHQSEPPL